jgi:hypothetical protein
LGTDESLSSAELFEEIAVRDGLLCHKFIGGREALRTFDALRVALLRGVGCQVFHDGYILQQVPRQVVPLL